MRKFVDWDSIEPLYRAGTLSIHKITDQYAADHQNSQTWKITVHHTAIIKKARQCGWTRNLAGKVKDRIKEKLVTKLVTKTQNGDQAKGKMSDNDIIERAAEEGSNVIIRHRDEIFALLEQEELLLTELKNQPKKLYLSTFRGKIIYKTIGLTVSEKSLTLKNLVIARSQRIMLERQAHNILEDTGKDKAPDLLKQIVGELPD
ncbi:MAG: hypothetical protein HOG03_24140 [Desulfobacula sp.]|jgi:hypothetical protein|uniref:hypothetical protein n=1 Tax=Desulfobacula sp. TaxID=2593537 RepID=UPI001EB6F853|nr:hypothetical protein [Desulfobacula sp.]